MGRSHRFLLVCLPFFTATLYGKQAFNHDSARKKISVTPFQDLPANPGFALQSLDATLGLTNEEQVSALLEALGLGSAWNHQVSQGVTYPNRAFGAQISLETCSCVE